MSNYAQCLPYYVMPALPPIIMLTGLTMMCMNMCSMCGNVWCWYWQWYYRADSADWAKVWPSSVFYSGKTKTSDEIGFSTWKDDSSRLNQEREWPLEFGNCLRRIAIVAVACSWTELLVELHAHVIKFYGLMFLRIPLNHKKRENDTPTKIPAIR